MTEVVHAESLAAPDVADELFRIISDAFISTDPHANPGKTHRFVRPVDDPDYADAFQRFEAKKRNDKDEAFEAITSLEKRAQISAKYATFRRDVDGRVQCESVFAFGVRGEYIFVAPPAEAGNASEPETIKAHLDLVTAVMISDDRHRIVALLEKSQTKIKQILISQLGGQENKKLIGRDRALIYNTFRSFDLTAIMLDPNAKSRINGESQLQKISDHTRAKLSVAGPSVWKFVKSLPGKIAAMIHVTIIKIGLRPPKK